MIKKKLTFDEMIMMFSLYETKTLLSTDDRHSAPHGHVILIPIQQVFALTSSCCRVRREATNTNFIVFLQEVSERQMLPERDKRKSQINIDHVAKKIKKHKKKTITSKQQSNANKPRKNRKQRTHGPMKYGLKSGVPGG
jgi:hypothetical protein